jgi:hypothetical protein
MARQSKDSTFSSALFREAEQREERNRKRRAARLKGKPARDDKILKRKVDYVAIRMAEGTSFTKARKEAGLSRGAFNKGTQGTQFLLRNEGGFPTKDARGRVQLNRKPTAFIDEGAGYRSVVAVGKNSAALREWQKALSVLENHNSSKAEIAAAKAQLRKISKQSIVDISGNKIRPAGNWDTIESGLSQMSSDELEAFDINRYRFTGGGV